MTLVPTSRGPYMIIAWQAERQKREDRNKMLRNALALRNQEAARTIRNNEVL